MVNQSTTYKVEHGLCSTAVQEIFTPNENDVNLRGSRDGDWVIPRADTVNYGTETPGCRGPITCLVTFYTIDCFQIGIG